MKRPARKTSTKKRRGGRLGSPPATHRSRAKFQLGEATKFTNRGFEALKKGECKGAFLNLTMARSATTASGLEARHAKDRTAEKKADELLDVVDAALHKMLKVCVLTKAKGRR